MATAVVAIGLADLPYGYYMLLRLLLCGISLFLWLGAGLELQDWQRWALGVSGVVYNPLIPIRLGEKGLWVIVNVASVVLFWFVAKEATFEDIIGADRTRSIRSASGCMPELQSKAECSNRRAS